MPMKTDDPLKTAFERCSNELSSAQDQAECRRYAAICNEQTKEDQDTFILTSIENYTITLKSLKACLANSLYMAANYGPPKIIPVENEIVPTGFHKAEPKLNKELGLDERYFRIYYLNGERDLILVDCIKDKKEVGFSSAHSGDIYMVKNGKAFEEIEHESPIIKSALAATGLDDLENSDPYEVLKYQELLDKQVPELKRLCEHPRENALQIGQCVVELAEQAEKIFSPDIDKQNAAKEFKNPDSDFKTKLASMLNGSAPSLFAGLGFFYSERTDPEKMDFCFKRASKLGYKFDMQEVEAARLRCFIKGVEVVLQKLESRDPLSSTELLAGIKRTQELLSAEEMDSNIPLIKASVPENATFLSQTSLRLENLKLKACKLIAEETFDKLSLAGKSDDDIIKKLFAIPLELKLKDNSTGNAIVREVIETKLNERSQKGVGIFTKQLRNHLSTPIVDEPGKWLQEFLKLAERAKFEAERSLQSTDPVFNEIRDLEITAYVEFFNASMASIEAEMSASSRSDSAKWFEDANLFFERCEEKLKFGEMPDGADKDKIAASVKKCGEDIKRARCEQLLRLTRDEMRAGEKYRYDWHQKASSYLDEAERLVARLSSGETLSSKIAELRTQILSGSIVERIAMIETEIEKLTMFDYSDLSANYGLKKIDDMIDSLLNDRSTKLSEVEKQKVKQLRATLYEKHVVYHLQKVDELIAKEFPKPSLQKSSWLVDVERQLSTAALYYSAKYSGESVLDRSKEDGYARTTQEKHSKAMEIEATVLITAAKDMAPSNGVPQRRSDWFEVAPAFVLRAREIFSKLNFTARIAESEDVLREFYKMEMEILRARFNALCENKAANREELSRKISQVTELINAKLPDGKDFLFSTSGRKELSKIVEEMKVQMKKQTAGKQF